MNRNQTVDVLSLIAANDQRTVGETDIAAFHSIIGDLDFDQATAAVVEHHRTSSERITAFHIIEGVRRANNDRLSRANANQSYRDQVEARRDAILAEALGGDQSLVLAPRRGTPASESTRREVMHAISAKHGHGGDVAVVVALGRPLDQITTDELMQSAKWTRNRAAAALYAALCVERGEPVPKPRERIKVLRESKATGAMPAHVTTAINELHRTWRKQTDAA